MLILGLWLAAGYIPLLILVYQSGVLYRNEIPWVFVAGLCGPIAGLYVVGYWLDSDKIVWKGKAMKTFDLVLCNRGDGVGRSLTRQLRHAGFGVRVAGLKDILVITCYDPLGDSPNMPFGWPKDTILDW
jgi:hypothetical protein